MALLESVKVGVNIDGVGGYAHCAVYDTGRIMVLFQDDSDVAWNVRAGIIIEYNGEEYPVASSSSERSVAFDYKRGENVMKIWGMYQNEIAGQTAVDNIPQDDGGDPSYVSIQWTVPNTAPTGTLSASTPFAGGTSTVSWKFNDADGDAVSLVRLVRYYKPAGGSSYSGSTLLSSAASGVSSYKDTLPASYGGGSVYYEITFEDDIGGTGSARTSAAAVIANSAPTVPGIPKLPAVINAGETITVTWDAATDADGNLEGYKLERSVDNGGSWAQVYQGSALSTTTTVPVGISTVMYRVKAYDYYGAESNYAITPIYTVITNTAPTAPAIVNLPAEIVRGSSATISWTASSDAEADAITYEVERSVDGGEYTPVTVTANKYYYDTIGTDWTTAQYRVRAVDSSGAKSGYTESAVGTVAQAYIPTLKLVSPAAGTDYGTADKPFLIQYRIKNNDSSQPVRIEYYVDGKYFGTDAYTAAPGTAETTRTNQFTGTDGDFWYKVPNGKHTMTVRAKCGDAVVSESFYFTKLVTDAVITLDEPMTSASQITVCIISVGGEIPADAEMIVEVTNNANDASPVWEDATAHALSGMNHAFTNSTQTNGWAFNFRVTVHGKDTRGFITSIQGGFQ